MKAPGPALAVYPPFAGEEHGVDPPASARATGLTLEALFEAHCEFVFRTCRRLGLDETAAEDATQQVFLVAARKRGAIAEGRERAFLLGVAQNVVANARRGMSRRREEMVEVDAPDEGALPDDLLDRARTRRLADEILDGMDVELRAAFVLFEVEELTFTEIAELLSIPRGTVASRVRRAREDFEARVKRTMGQRGGAR